MKIHSDVAHPARGRSNPNSPALPATLEDWKARLKLKQEASVVGILEFGRELFEFKKWCTRKQGGTVFAKTMHELFAMSQPTAAQWCGIGAEYDKLIRYANKLPASRTTIYEVASLSPEQIEQNVTLEATREFVLQVKAWAKANGTSDPTLSKPAWRQVHQAWASRYMQGSYVFLAAVKYGLNAKDYPTYELLEAAIGEEDAKRLQNREARDPPFQVVPDGSDVGAVAQVTALQPHMAMPLHLRLQWATKFGYNANVVLGLPFGLADRTYITAFQSERALVGTILGKLAMRSLQYSDCIALLRRALKDLCVGHLRAGDGVNAALTVSNNENPREVAASAGAETMTTEEQNDDQADNNYEQHPTAGE